MVNPGLIILPKVNEQIKDRGVKPQEEHCVYINLEVITDKPFSLGKYCLLLETPCICSSLFFPTGYVHPQTKQVLSVTQFKTAQ